MNRNVRSILLLLCTSILLQPQSWGQSNKNMKYAILPHFRLNYDRNVAGRDIQLVEKELQRAYDRFSERLAFAPSSKFNVYLYSSKERPRGVLLYKVLDDSYYDNGKLVILASALHGEQQTVQALIDRVVARAYLGTIVRCPAWLGEVYSFAVSYEFTKFGKPTRGHLADFSDLGEDLQQAERESDLRAVYANIATSAKFLIDQYGDAKLDEVIKSVRNGHAVDEAMESAFGAKYDTIEHAWAQYMGSAIKG